MNLLIGNHVQQVGLENIVRVRAKINIFIRKLRRACTLSPVMMVV